jgi:hypothetical protein
MSNTTHPPEPSTLEKVTSERDALLKELNNLTKMVNIHGTGQSLLHPRVTMAIHSSKKLLKTHGIEI